jgi:hypothetical protein
MTNRAQMPTVSPSNLTGGNSQSTVPSATSFGPDVLDREIQMPRPGQDVRIDTATRDSHPSVGSEERRINIPVVDPRVPEARPSRERFLAMAKWRGRVLEVNGGTFRAVLSPIVGDEHTKEADIYVEDISPDEHTLIRPGAWFYWSIGYHVRKSGVREKMSLFRFVRMPRWRSRDIAEAKARAAREADIFGDQPS